MEYHAKELNKIIDGVVCAISPMNIPFLENRINNLHSIKYQVKEHDDINKFNFIILFISKTGRILSCNIADPKCYTESKLFYSVLMRYY